MALSNEHLNPIYVINDYVWKLLQQEMGLTKINSLVPITTADGPKFREADKPYIVYAYSEESSASTGPMHSFNALYAVYAPTADVANRIIALISSAFTNIESVDNILSWSNHSSNPNGGIFKGINLGMINTLGSESADPAVDEGGLVNGVIMFRYSFTAPDYDFSIVSTR